MFAGLIVFLLLGYPVAFSLSAVGLAFGALAIELGYFPLALMQALPDRIFGIVGNQLLLSIPFFTFMGAERCGLAEDLLDTILLGSIPWVLIMLIMVALVILFPGMVDLSVQRFARL